MRVRVRALHEFGVGYRVGKVKLVWPVVQDAPALAQGACALGAAGRNASIGQCREEPSTLLVALKRLAVGRFARDVPDNRDTL